MNKHINFSIIARILGIVLTVMITSLLSFRFNFWIILPLGLILLAWQTVSIIYMMNRTNRQIAFFFDAIRNEDSTLHFPVHTGNKTVDGLNVSMNRLNKVIGEAKMQNRLQEQYFETLIEQAATGLITFDENGHILQANTSARKLLGLEPLTHISQLEKVEKGLSKVFMEIIPDRPRLVTLTNERGSMQLSLRATGMSIRNSNVRLVSVQDIRNELDEKETESWVRLIRVLTHEIMNSIAPITSLSETLTGYFLDGESIRKPGELDEHAITNTVKGLKVISERGDGLVKFVDSYRTLTHLREPNCKTVNLMLLIDKVKLLLCSELDFSHASLSIDIQQQDLTAFVDEDLFSQVIINLVRNSWEALKHQEHGDIRIRAYSTGSGHTALEVTDNGPGIPAGLLDKIFVPFFTTREKGSGIGLSLSRQIIRLHGGTLSVKSQAGSTCFEILL